MSDEMKYKMSVLVRNDLGMGKGKIAAQVAHACVYLAVSPINQSHKKLVDDWLADGQRKVVLKVDNLEHLMEIASTCKTNNMPTCIIQDRGLTQVEPHTVTCMAIGPDLHENIDKITNGLKLL